MPESVNILKKYTFTSKNKLSNASYVSTLKDNNYINYYFFLEFFVKFLL